jgi:hypothetical protein
MVSLQGDSLIPDFGGNRPVMVDEEGDRRDSVTAAAWTSE